MSPSLLILDYFLLVSRAGLVSTFLGLVPPPVLGVLLLFALTMFFQGEAPPWRAALAAGERRVRAFLGYLILPSVSLIGALLVVLVLIGWHDPLRPMFAMNDVDGYPISLAVRVVFMRGARLALDCRAVQAAAITLFVVPMASLAFLMLAVVRVLYLDRLALRAGYDQPGLTSPDLLHGTIVKAAH